MILAALCALILMLAGLRAVLDRRERARHAALAKELKENLEDLFFNCVCPEYADGRLRFFSWSQRKRLLWGKWIICVAAVCSKSIQLNVPDLGLQRILRLLENSPRYQDAIVYFNVIWEEKKDEYRHRTTSELRRRTSPRNPAASGG